MAPVWVSVSEWLQALTWAMAPVWVSVPEWLQELTWAMVPVWVSVPEWLQALTLAMVQAQHLKALLEKAPVAVWTPRVFQATNLKTELAKIQQPASTQPLGLSSDYSLARRLVEQKL
jgi:hypothetical protein